jgi:hypothetical protein
MVADWMPEAVRKPVPYRAEAGAFTSPPLGWVLHVVVGNGSPFVTFRDAPKGNRRFSHFWVSKTGVIEQYAETSNRSWAQAAGNPLYWAVETEGFPTEPLTPEQVAALARIHTFLGTPDTLASKPGDRGIGTHYMGGAAWGGHTCPDPTPGAGPRSQQRADIIAAAQGVDVPLTDSEIAAIATEVLTRPVKDLAGNTVTVGAAIGYTLRNSTAAAQGVAKLPSADDIATAIVSKLPAGSVDTPTLAKAVVDELASRGLSLSILGKA